jgi:DNA invertase Pin-like site-specific DNA recombinase
MKVIESAVRVVVYARVSTEEQALSVEAQLDDCREYAATRGWTVDRECVDRGVSGGAPIDERPALVDALAALDAGASVLLVAKRDRLARDTMAAAMLERMAERAGARIECADGVGNGNSPEALLLRRMVDAFAEYERALIRARTRTALAKKKRNGERLGRPRFGWRVEAGELVEDAREQEVLRLVAELRSDGLSLRQIVAELDARGHRTAGGRPFALSAVQGMAAKAAA